MAEQTNGRNGQGGRPVTEPGRGVRCWRDAAENGLAEVLDNGRRNVRRARQRARLLGDEPISGSQEEIAAAVRMRLERALRAERRRGQARHWTYDFNRHLALLQALATLDDETSGRAP